MFRRRIILAGIGIALALGIVLSMSTCNLFGYGTLTIRNYSSDDLDFVNWTSNNGITYGLGRDTVWDYTLNGVGGWVTDGLRALGGSDSRQVDFGSDYVSFFFTTSAIGHRTLQLVDVNLFTDGSFTFYDGFAFLSLRMRDGSTQTQRFDYVTVPGLTKPARK